MISIKRNGHGQSGFTLVELLVSIAIILLLLGILLPALKSIVTQGKITAASTQLSSVANACEQYAGTFRAYPGYFSERDMQVKGIANRFLTPNENMMLSLVGGVLPKDEIETDDQYTVSGLQSGLVVNINYSDGPVTNPLNQAKRRKFAQFYSPKPTELLEVTGGASSSLNDNEMKELVDPINRQPILYFRAVKNNLKPVDWVAVRSNGQGVASYGLFSQTHYLNSTETSGTLYSNARNQTQEARSLMSAKGAGQEQAVNNFAWYAVNRQLSSISPNSEASHNDDNDLARGGVFLMSAGPDGVYMNRKYMDSDFSDDNEIKLLSEFERYLESNDDIVLSSGTRG